MSHRKAAAGPTASPAKLFGEAVRFARERAGLTQEALGKLLHCDRTVVTRYEGGHRPMPLDTVLACDEILQTGGMLHLLWKRVDWQADVEHPDWFQKYVDLESEALAIRVYQYARVNGLLQCADYAYALFRAGLDRDNPALLEERVAARMSRQKRLLGPDGPLHIAVLDESAIRSAFGGPNVMRRQMEHLLEVGERPNISIQVAPFGCVPSRRPATSMFLMEMPDGSEWLYSESLYRGHFSDSPSVVAEHRGDYDLLRGHVLSVSDSRALIADAMEEYRYEERGSQRGGVADEQLQRRSRGRVRRGGPRVASPRHRPGA
ncbi:Scr1 family TA system antitoxin-like transcriptional regulator [Kitasatospora sp. NPDC056184]|uniref:helix-turn-helix domain-containing protein n=1 Tax=Kitasatospora sp. NPDC056184 TaxID=3345738 RepID=UPI0035D58B89